MECHTSPSSSSDLHHILEVRREDIKNGCDLHMELYAVKLKFLPPLSEESNLVPGSLNSVRSSSFLVSRKMREEMCNMARKLVTMSYPLNVVC